MNLHSMRKRSGRAYSSTKNTIGGKKLNRSAHIVLTVLFFCLCFAAVLVGHLHLCQLRLRSAERSVKIEEQLKFIQAETMQLRNQCAALTGWAHVQRKMVQFKLNLVPAAPGQIVNIGVYTPKQAAAIPLKQLTVAARTQAKSPSLRRGNKRWK